MRGILCIFMMAICFVVASKITSAENGPCDWTVSSVPVASDSSLMTIRAEGACVSGVDKLEVEQNSKKLFSSSLKGAKEFNSSWNVHIDNEEYCVRLIPWVGPAPAQKCLLPDAAAEATPAVEITAESAHTVGTCEDLNRRFGVGQTAKVPSATQNPRLRSQPTSKGKFLLVPLGQKVTIVDGPVCAEGLVWYKVSYGEHEGWIPQDIHGIPQLQ